MDAVKNFAYSTVLTPPSPAASGATLVVQSGEGARFPATPFNAVITPAGTLPIGTNAEVVRVTGRAVDTLTITRTQEGSSARTITAGDQIFAGVTAKMLTDLALPSRNVFNVMDPVYAGGAKGDGSTDDTAAIIAAETAAGTSGGILYFPPGTYMTGPLIGRSNVWYRGAGIGATTLKANVGATSVIGGSAVAQTNVRISDMTIDGNEAALAVTSHGIVPVQYTKVVIDNVRVKNTRNIGIYLYQCVDVLIEGCEIDSIAQTRTPTADGSQAGISIFGCTRVRVLGNRVDTVNDSGIYCGSTTCREITIVGNTVRNPTFIGIALGTTTRAATVAGNTVVGSIEGGIDPGSCISSTITGNTMIDCGNGVVFDGAVDCVCSGNTVNNATGVDSLHFGSGISAGNSKRLVIEGNSVADTYGVGYSFDICDDLLVRGNIAKNCGGTGHAVGYYDAFSLGGSGASSRVRFIDNQAIDDRATPRTGYGISIKPFGAGVLTDIRVVGTVTSGMVTGPLLWNSTVTGSVGDDREFNVMDFGAKGDGVADDTVTCQRAIDAAQAAGGGRVYFPRGIYKLTQQGTTSGLGWCLVVTGDNITLCGAGPSSVLRTAADATILMADGSAAAEGPLNWYAHWVFRPSVAAHPLYAITPAAKGDPSVTLTVASNAANFAVGDYILVRTGQTAPSTSEQPDSEIARVTAKAGAVLTLDRPLAKPYVQENYPVGHASAGLPAPLGIQNFKGTVGARALIRNLALRELRFEQPAGNVYSAINIAQADGVTIEDCELEGTQGGFTTSRVRHLRAYNNRIRLNAVAWQWGFSPDTGTSDIVIEGNVISSAGAAYIHLHEGCAAARIRDNYIYSSGVTGEASAIDIRARAYDIEVVGNTIIGGGTVGAAITADSTVTGGGVISDNNINVPSLVGAGIAVNGSNWTVYPSDTMLPRAVSIGDPTAPYVGLLSGPQQTIKYLAWLTKDRKTATVFNLPFNFVVEACTVWVDQAFNSDGTDLINVGNPSWGANCYANAIDASTTGQKVGAPFAPGAPYQAVGTPVIATYTNGGSAPTTGKALVVVSGYQAPYTPL